MVLVKNMRFEEKAMLPKSNNDEKVAKVKIVRYVR